MTVLRIFILLAISATITLANFELTLPDPFRCLNRIRHEIFVDTRGVTHSYFFSWESDSLPKSKLDWLDARNLCRLQCRDTVSLETPQENAFIKYRMFRGGVREAWTSGRKCNFDYCDNHDENYWLWFGSNEKINPLSLNNLGHGKPCLAILNNTVNENLKWHDVGCNIAKPFICEDSDELLNLVRSQNPTMRV